MPIATYKIGDKLRDESSDAVAKLAQSHAIQIISGDTHGAVGEIAKCIGLSPHNWRGEMTPEQKLLTIQGSPHCMMVGDGANDELALKAATIGVSVFGSLDTSLKSADVALLTPGLMPLVTLFAIGRENQRIMSRNFRLSIAYNLVFGALAVMGHMTPLLAAIVMPISSLSVILSSILRKKRAAR